MFCRFAKSRRSFRRSISQSSEEVSLLDIYLNSRFYVSVMLILSYLILMVGPSLTRAYFNIMEIPMSKSLRTYIDISVTLSDTADGIIYIFMDRKVRTLFMKKWKTRLSCTVTDRRESTSKNYVCTLEETVEVTRL